jgi:dTDP-4-dehydrorhamnose 3,5-epimerase
MSFKGMKDQQSVVAGGGRFVPPKIAGVEIVELGNVITRSGWMCEIFRADRAASDISVRQVNWVQLNPGAVTDWHAHARQTDRIVGIGGNIKLALWDARKSASSHGVGEIIRLGAARPVMVVVFTTDSATRAASPPAILSSSTNSTTMPIPTIGGSSPNPPSCPTFCEPKQRCRASAFFFRPMSMPPRWLTPCVACRCRGWMTSRS